MLMNVLRHHQFVDPILSAPTHTEVTSAHACQDLKWSKGVAMVSSVLRRSPEYTAWYASGADIYRPQGRADTPLGRHNLQADTPPGRPPLDRHLHQVDTPPKQTPWVDTPTRQTPPYPGRHPLRRLLQRPTGMHSCHSLEMFIHDLKQLNEINPTSHRVRTQRVDLPVLVLKECP